MNWNSFALVWCVVNLILLGWYCLTPRDPLDRL